MRSAICAALSSLRTRQQLLFGLRGAAFGLAVSTGAGIILGIFRLLSDTDHPLAIRAGIVAAGPVLGLLIGLLSRRSWHGAAAAVDKHYDLKDRTVTALAFANDESPTELTSLQFADAMEHLRMVEPKVVEPLR